MTTSNAVARWFGILGTAALLAGCGTTRQSPGNSAASLRLAVQGTDRMPAGKVYGLTLDNIESLPEILGSLSALSRRATVRIVFDEGMPASYYAPAVNQISKVSYVMGELLDSYTMRTYTRGKYNQRVSEYLNAFANTVDIWEVGNEINGEWLGKTADVVAKMTAAYDTVKARGKATELTLYYNQDCWAKRENEMFTWAQAQIPPRMKKGLDYVLVSYYEDDCNNLQPNWPVVFNRLGQMFPNSRIGFAEVGTKFADRKAAYLQRYYSMEIAHPRYVGGYFWWYGRQDLVPQTSLLWAVFNLAISQH